MKTLTEQIEALRALASESFKVTSWRVVTASGVSDPFDSLDAITAAADDMPPEEDAPEVLAERWTGVLILENTRTDDFREIADNALTWRELPLPLMFLPDTTMGHQEATVCGMIEAIARDAAGKYNGDGSFDLEGEAGREASRLLVAGIIRWVSADLAVSEYDMYEEGDCTLPDEDEIDSVGDLFEPEDCKLIFRVIAGKIMGATMVPFPAFEDAVIEAVAASGETVLAWNVVNGEKVATPAEILRAGVSHDEGGARRYFTHPQPLDGTAPERKNPDPVVRSELTASAVLNIPNVPPAEWFDDPQFGTSDTDDDRLVFQLHTQSYACPITITEDGRVFGHIATWDSCHVGFEDVCVPPPRSQTNYAMFLLHELPVEGCDCDTLAIGHLTIGGGHADKHAKLRAATEHYDNVASAWADVAAGEDHIGIWIAGTVRPGTTEEQLRLARSLAPSGDWRRHGGNLELVAVCQVNVPGYPITRRSAEAYVAGGQPMTLIASGPVAPSDDRLAVLERRMAAVEAIAEPFRDMARARYMTEIRPVPAELAAE